MATSHADARRIERALLANDAARPLTVILAPWATEHVLAPDAAVVVVAEGPAGDRAGLLVERTCDTATVWAWAGADARLLAPDGSVLVDWSGSPVPPPAIDAAEGAG